MKKKIDPRQVQPIAYVVDSSGQPLKHWWTPSGKKKPVYEQIAIYWQETSLPDDVKGVHTVWYSNENHGDEYPWKKGAQRPEFLSRFMKEATSGKLSATFKLTEWGRLVADSRCKCNHGGKLQETKRTESKKDERGGMSSREWKKYQRKLKLGH